jgi:uncharacterized protein (TIGR02996 family)
MSPLADAERDFLDQIKQNQPGVARNYADWLLAQHDPRGEFLRDELDLAEVFADMLREEPGYEPSWLNVVRLTYDLILDACPESLRTTIIRALRDQIPQKKYPTAGALQHFPKKIATDVDAHRAFWFLEEVRKHPEVQVQPQLALSRREESRNQLIESLVILNATEEEASFLHSLIDHPGDRTTRLVYADWLEERNDARSHYLRRADRFTLLMERVHLAVRDHDPEWVTAVAPRWTLTLHSYPPAEKIYVIKTLLELTGARLAEAKTLSENLPVAIQTELRTTEISQMLIKFRSRATVSFQPTLATWPDRFSPEDLRAKIIMRCSARIPESAPENGSLENWLRLRERIDWHSFASLEALFPELDQLTRTLYLPPTDAFPPAAAMLDLLSTIGRSNPAFFFEQANKRTRESPEFGLFWNASARVDPELAEHWKAGLNAE